jgi:flagellar basal-body rod protein FlgF
MDKMVHTALNSLKMILQNQQITSQNIANASVVGYRKDSNSEFGTVYLNSDKGLNTRVFATRQVGAFSNQQGDLESTENPLDIAIKGEGFFLIQPVEGEVALSRRGDFKVDNAGLLVNGEGSLVLGEDLQPINLPAFNKVNISSDGIISIKATDAPQDAPYQEAATIGTTLAEDVQLEKDKSGFIKPKAITNENGDIEIPEINADQGVQMVNNYLEKSNVNPVEELILTLEHQRNYETHVKFIDLAKKMDEGGASLMRTPE